jgi:hypothetical protein
MNQSETPFQEAISVISIASMLVGVGCYLAAANHVAFLSPALFWVAIQVYHFFPSLGALRLSEAPMLVSAVAVGILFFALTIPLAYWLASLFSRGGVQSLERQTYRLRKHRERIKKTERDRDDFLVS